MLSSCSGLVLTADYCYSGWWWLAFAPTWDVYRCPMLATGGAGFVPAMEAIMTCLAGSAKDLPRTTWKSLSTAFLRTTNLLWVDVL